MWGYTGSANPESAETNPQQVDGVNISRVFQELAGRVDSMSRMLGRFRVSLGEEIIERTSEDFGVIIGEGTRPGFSLKTSRTVVSGVPGTVVAKQITVDGTSIIRNMTLVCDGNTPAVYIEAGGHCILDGCHIAKTEAISGATNSYVYIEAGGQLNVVSSMFHGAQAAGFVVDNAGAAGDVDVTGCVNLTGRLHNNVTIVGEVP